MATGDTPSNPFALALNAQRELLETTTGAFERAEVAEERVEQMDSVGVGETPSEVVYTENKLELLHYESQTDEQHDVPIIVVYALINKPYILDLQPDRSVIRRLLEGGHDVYLVDWNEPSRLDQHLTIEDYVDRYVDNCVDVVRERSGQDSINVLGYCMGGTLSAMYAALHTEKVRTLGLMASGLCFDDTGGVLELWGGEDYYDPEDVTRTYGNMPAEMLDIGFALMDPVANYVSKYVRLYDNLENEDFVRNFARMEKWLSEGIDVAGETYVEFIREIYQDNKLHRNEYELGGRHVDVTSIDVPMLQIVGEYDHLIPAESSKPFNEVVGSDDVTTIEYPTGHIGLAVSGSSHRDVWPEVAEWYLEKSTGVPEDVTTVDEEDEEDGVEVALGDVATGDAEEVEVAVDDEETGVEEAMGDELEEGEGASVPEESEATTEPSGTDEARDVDEESFDPADAEGDDLEEIAGIGPTYAQRLIDAGIEYVADLADADADAVADAAEVGVERARDWIDQAGQ